MKINEELSVQHMMDLLAAKGPSGGEGPVAELVKDKLLAAGCRPDWFFEDVGRERLPKDFTTGNLIVKIPGTIEGPRLMFSAHLDTVPICQGAVPVKKGSRIVPEGNTGLGADNRASVATIISMVDTLLEQNLSFPPLTLLFTVGEENGLHGAKAFLPEEGDNPAMCFNIDGCSACDGIIGALGAIRWSLNIKGKSAHAAANPEGGISAAIIAANAIADLKANGYFGRIALGKITGTANIGSIRGGEVDNQVMDQLTITGECRSHHPDALDHIMNTYHAAFEKAASELTNSAGECGSVEFSDESDYRSFLLDETEPVVQRFLKAAPLAGRKPKVEVINAGLDANILNEKGIPTLTFDAGNYDAHALTEYVEIPRYLEACELAVALATVK